MKCEHKNLVDGYYGHDCADCGELVYPYGCAPWDDGDDWDDDDPEMACVECGKLSIDYCQCCGGPLCGMHSEVGCGFCKDCPTAEWIAAEETAARADGAGR